MNSRIQTQKMKEIREVSRRSHEGNCDGEW